ncbi:hypothetical protein [Devosia sp. YR412]|uniref:hypothetical protein n=1 Tax=Devosia sp. YR412 TaxID=1881030 RepID=UPI000B8679A4|nr:hypothetical protein [Devosia sp. YR412]
MRLVLVIALLLSTAPAFAADAVIYKGTLGGKDIVVELTDPSADQVVGRYSYLSQGGDIPLSSVDTSEGVVTLAEEAPCTETTCVFDDNYEIVEVPIGAHWQLRVKDDGSITGGWNPADGSAVLDIELTEVARRTLPEDMAITPADLADSAWVASYDNPAAFSRDSAPYDFAKMDVALTEGPTRTMDGNSYRDVIDPRSKFPFPRVVAFADGSPVEAANTRLAARHAQINMSAFACLSKAYAGLGYRDGMGGGGLGDFDGESIEIAYLSPTVINWTETGSTYCGGAYPNNHFDSYIIDARTGADFALGWVLKDWIATADTTNYEPVTDQAAALENPNGYLFAPGQPLIDYALAYLDEAGLDPDLASECQLPDLIAEGNLGFRFAPENKLVFAITGLAHANFACSEDVLTVSLSDIPELLALTASDYFPDLAN